MMRSKGPGRRVGAVAGDHLRARPGRREVRPRGVGDLGLELDARDLAAERVDDRGVVAGARADLEHARARAHVEPVEHPRHQARLARRRGRDAVLVVRDDRLVRVGGGEVDVREEDVARNRVEGVEDGLGGTATCSRSRAISAAWCAAASLIRAPAAPPLVVASGLVDLVQQVLRLGHRALEQRLLDDARAGERVDGLAAVAVAQQAGVDERADHRAGRGGALPGRQLRVRRPGRERVQGVEQGGAARGLGQVDRRLGVRRRLQLGADEHHHLGGEHALRDELPARVADPLRAAAPPRGAR